MTKTTPASQEPRAKSQKKPSFRYREPSYKIKNNDDKQPTGSTLENGTRQWQTIQSSRSLFAPI